jgi:hypothetical protein
MGNAVATNAAIATTVLRTVLNNRGVRIAL